jgi:hypothetical protein
MSTKNGAAKFAGQPLRESEIAFLLSASPGKAPSRPKNFPPSTSTSPIASSPFLPNQLGIRQGGGERRLEGAWRRPSTPPDTCSKPPRNARGLLLFARPSLDALREENEDALLAFTVRCTVAEKLWKGKELKNDRVCVETLIRLVDAVISLSLERPKGWM